MNIQKICLNCSKEFEVIPSRKDAKFCCKKCVDEYIKGKPIVQRIKCICKYCNVEFEVTPARFNQDKNKYCSPQCYGFSQRGSNKKDKIKAIYKTINVTGENSLYHRYVMEKHLGRKLLRSEHVHHINEDKHDNRIENLMLTNVKEHNYLHKQKYSLTKICEVCGIEFTPNPTKRKRAKTCSVECGQILSQRNRPHTSDEVKLSVYNEYIQGGITQTQLGNKYGLKQSTVSEIIIHMKKLQNNINQLK